MDKAESDHWWWSWERQVCPEERPLLSGQASVLEKWYLNRVEGIAGGYEVEEIWE